MENLSIMYTWFVPINFLLAFFISTPGSMFQDILLIFILVLGVADGQSIKFREISSGSTKYCMPIKKKERKKFVFKREGKIFRDSEFLIIFIKYILDEKNRCYSKYLKFHFWGSVVKFFRFSFSSPRREIR